MKITEISATAVIPTAQYANIQATITVEVGEDVEEAKAEALRHIEQISAQYAEIGKAIPQLHQDSSASPSVAQKALTELASELTGGKAFFEPDAHVYTNQFGHKFLSGSEFAEKFSPEFNADFIIPKMEAKYGVDGKDIKDMWKTKAEASQHIGTAIHAALELYGKYVSVGLAIDRDKEDEDKKWSHVHDNPILNQAVRSFYVNHQDEQAVYEGFVANNDALLCGSIDRLLITGEKRCIVTDFKTNSNPLDKKGIPKLEQVGSPKFLAEPFGDLLNTKMNHYWLQLSFYAYILQLDGWIVEGLIIHHYDGIKWTDYHHEVIDISRAKILQDVKNQ